MAAPSSDGLNFDIIQGDILQGLSKKRQSFVFFVINDIMLFRNKLEDSVVPLITTTAQALADRATIAERKRLQVDGLVELVGTNIAFTQEGLAKLGIKPDDLSDVDFLKGQANSASDLGDPAWDPKSPFTKPIHGCFNIAGNSEGIVQERIDELAKILKDITTTVHRVDGTVRPGLEKGHEHFGFLDNISLPVVSGFKEPNPGEDVIKPGVILLGRPGDTQSRPPWAADSSFMVFRQLQQFVPEFNKFVQDKARESSPLMTADLLGARMMGRWKSGAPVSRNPTADKPEEGGDITKANLFDYVAEAEVNAPQLKCPFATHTRKMNPRAGTPGPAIVKQRLMLRRGIPYGPELTPEENGPNGTTTEERGLLFVCYQSEIDHGFAFLQKIWANNVNFPNQGDGLDPIIGQGTNKFTTGMNPKEPSVRLDLPVAPFVKPIGGVYMISPSIKALSNPPFAPVAA